MEAKDTVMKNDLQLHREYRSLIIDNAGGHGEWNIERLLEAQAETTFPKGEEQGIQKGRQEVMEWLSQYYRGLHNQYSGLNTYLIPRDEIQAKLKECQTKKEEKK